MPQATNRDWLTAQVRLPWWRQASRPSASRVHVAPQPYTYANLHWTTDEARQVIQSIVRDHPAWTREQVKREMLRRFGVLKADGTRRQAPVSKAEAPTEPAAKATSMADVGPLPFTPDRELTQYERKVDFAGMARSLTTLEQSSVARVRAILAGARDKLLALVRRKLQEGALSTTFVNGLELRGLGHLVPTLREMLRTGFDQGTRHARAEVHRGAKAHALRETDYRASHTLDGLPPEQALAFFESKAALLAADLRDPILSDVKNVLYQAIKTGQPLREMMDALQGVFLGYLGDPDQMIDDALLTPYRLETLVRTNLIESLNEGRKAEVAPEVASGFVIGFQFSAVLDKRTTEVCRYLDAKCFKADSPELDALSPPRHYSCRSVLVTILRSEGPVQFITSAQVAKGKSLSGKGFCDAHPAHNT